MTYDGSEYDGLRQGHDYDEESKKEMNEGASTTYGPDGT